MMSSIHLMICKYSDPQSQTSLDIQLSKSIGIGNGDGTQEDR